MTTLACIIPAILLFYTFSLNSLDTKVVKVGDMILQGFVVYKRVYMIWGENWEPILHAMNLTLSRIRSLMQ